MNAGKRDAYQCPSMADLSAWHDSELRDRALEQHVANCPRCLRLLQSFRVIDDRAVTEVTLEPAALQRIKCNCVRQIRQQPRMVRLSVVLRLAAVFVLAAAVLVFRGRLVGSEHLVVASATPGSNGQNLHHSDMRSGVSASAAGAAVAVASPSPGATPGTGAEFDASLPPWAAEPATMAATTEPHGGMCHELSSGNISLVSYEDGSGMVPCSSAAPAPAAGATAGPVHCLVRHVWLVEEPARPLQDLGLMAPAQQAELARLAEQHRPQYVVRLRLTDQTLAALVDHFAEQGYKLLSPDAPQPKAAAALTGRDVEYDLTIVQK